MKRHEYKAGDEAYLIFPRTSFAGLLIVDIRRFKVKRAYTRKVQIVEANPIPGCIAKYRAQIVFPSVAEAINQTLKRLPKAKRARLIREFEWYFSEVKTENDRETQHSIVEEDLK